MNFFTPFPIARSTLNSEDNIKPGAIIITMLYNTETEGAHSPTHFGIVVGATEKHPKGVIHLTRKGLQFHSLDFFLGSFPKQAVAHITNPICPKLGEQAANQAEIWLWASPVSRDVRKYNLAAQSHIRGDNPDKDYSAMLLRTLKRTLYRDKPFCRQTQDPRAGRGSSCTEFVVNCYNVAAMGAWLDANPELEGIPFLASARLPKEKASYVSIKYANNEETETYAAQEQKRVKLKLNTRPGGYNDSPRFQGSVFDIETTLPQHHNHNDGPVYKNHIRGPSPVALLPRALQDKESWEKLIKILPLPIDPKHAVTQNLYELLIGPDNKTMGEMQSIHPTVIEAAKERLSTESKTTQQELTQALSASHAGFWSNQPYQTTLGRLRTHDNHFFAENFKFILPAEIYTMLEQHHLTDATLRARQCQCDFVNNVKNYKTETLGPKYQDLRKQLTEINLKTSILDGLPDRGAKNYLNKLSEELSRSEQPDLHKKVVELKENVEHYIEINQLLMKLVQQLEEISRWTANCQTIVSADLRQKLS